MLFVFMSRKAKAKETEKHRSSQSLFKVACPIKRFSGYDARSFILQKNAEHSATAIINHPLQRSAYFVLGIVRHTH